MNKYLVTWWKYSSRRDEYVDFDLEVYANSQEQAISEVKKTRKGRHFTAQLWH